MNARVHRAFANDEPTQKARAMSERIYRTVQMLGARQVRVHPRGWIVTYPYPAPRGYGTRGLFVGIYTLSTRLEWIEEDILMLLSDSRPCGRDSQAI